MPPPPNATIVTPTMMARIAEKRPLTPGRSSLASSASRRTGVPGPERLTDVLHRFLHRDLGCVGSFLEVRIDNVPLVSVRLVGLAASTGHAHLFPSLSGGFRMDGFPTHAHPNVWINDL